MVTINRRRFLYGTALAGAAAATSMLPALPAVAEASQTPDFVSGLVRLTAVDYQNGIEIETELFPSPDVCRLEPLDAITIEQFSGRKFIIQSMTYVPSPDFDVSTPCQPIGGNDDR